MKTAQKHTDNNAKVSQGSGKNPLAQIANNSKEAAAQRALIDGVNDSPRMLAQRRQIEGYGEADQRATVPKPGPAVAQRQTPAPASAPDGIVNQDVREAIINGGYADKGEYKLQTSTRTFKETTQVWKMGRKVATEVEKTESIINSTFTDAALEKEKQYLDANWAGKIDISKSTGGSGDTKGKHIDMPGWVYEYQNKLAAQKARDYVPKAWEKGNNPNWDKDSFLAQRVLEAFLRAWHKKELPDEKSVPSNIEELYKRTGVSEKAHGNAQATLLGDPNVYGWCGPATYNAVVLGLLKNGLRFNTGKPPVTAATLENRNKQQAQFIKNSIKWKYKTISDDELNAKYQAELAKMAFLEEVNAQAAFFIGNNTQKQKGWLKAGRFVSGQDAYANYAFKSGDVITQALMNGSPVSGHVLTVIKEERNADFKGEPGTAVSTLYGISGNAGSIGGGSVKIEKFIREMPPASLKDDLSPISSLGNRMTVAADDRKGVQSAETARLAREQGVPAHKVAKADVDAATEAKQGERKSVLQEKLTAAEADFQGKAGMSHRDYIKAKSAKNPPLAIIQIGRTHKDLIAAITRLMSQIRVIDDYTNVPAEAKAKGVAYSPQDARYSEQSGGAGRFRPNELGHIWITTIIKAAEYADAHKINADLNLDAEGREKKIKELGWDEKLAPDKFKEMILEKYGMQQLSGSVDALWPGAIAAIEGESLARDYR